MQDTSNCPYQLYIATNFKPTWVKERLKSSTCPWVKDKNHTQKSNTRALLQVSNPVTLSLDIGKFKVPLSLPPKNQLLLRFFCVYGCIKLRLWSRGINKIQSFEAWMIICICYLCKYIIFPFVHTIFFLLIYLFLCLLMLWLACMCWCYSTVNVNVSCKYNIFLSTSLNFFCAFQFFSTGGFVLSEDNYKMNVFL